jgi:hypothetical protein
VRTRPPPSGTSSGAQLVHADMLIRSLKLAHNPPPCKGGEHGCGEGGRETLTYQLRCVQLAQTARTVQNLFVRLALTPAAT